MLQKWLWICLWLRKWFLSVSDPPRVDDNMDKEMIGFVSRSVLINCPMMGEPAISCYWSRVGQQEIPATRLVYVPYLIQSCLRETNWEVWCKIFYVDTFLCHLRSFYTFWLKRWIMCISIGLRLFVKILSITCVFWRHQRVKSCSVNGRKRRFLRPLAVTCLFSRSKRY